MLMRGGVREGNIGEVGNGLCSGAVLTLGLWRVTQKLQASSNSCHSPMSLDQSHSDSCNEHATGVGTSRLCRVGDSTNQRCNMLRLLCLLGDRLLWTRSVPLQDCCNAFVQS
jgi:hypothetical protein